MINKLYSLLVSGCNTIPKDFSMYRKYTVISSTIDGVPTYTDPCKRALWANYIIELAKVSDLFEEILNADPSNSYKVSPHRDDYINTNIMLDIPTVEFIRSKSQVIHDIIDEVDINNVWDRAALFCLYVLRSADVR